MATMPAKRELFVDTNVLVYAVRSVAPLHHDASTMLRRLEGEYEICISRQVIRELVSVLLRTDEASNSVSHEAAVESARHFAGRYRVLEEDTRTTSQLLRLVEIYRPSPRRIHDLNIVAVMLLHGVRRLCTYNRADFTACADQIELVP